MSTTSLANSLKSRGRFGISHYPAFGATGATAPDFKLRHYRVNCEQLAMSLPCSTCAAECCGPVPIGTERMKKIIALLSNLPRREIKRLLRQKREPLTCKFVDTENNRCAVYDARMPICEAYGKFKGLECPHSPLVQISYYAPVFLPSNQEGKTVALSNNFNWKALL